MYDENSTSNSKRKSVGYEIGRTLLSHPFTIPKHWQRSHQTALSMTGNENVDRTRNFFEQVNSSQRLQSQATGGNWPVLNNNTWVGIQGQNGMSLTSNRQQDFDHEHKMPMRDASSLLSGKSNGWNMNASLADNEDYTLEVPDNNEPKLHAQRDNIERTMLMERDHDDNIRSKNSYMGNFTAGMTSNTLKLNKDIIQHVSHQHHLDYGKHVAVGSMNYKGDEDVARYQSQLSRQLNDNQLTGIIPAELGKLDELFELNLAGNSLEGPIPRNISSCTALNQFNVHGNRLNGSIPLEFQRLESLTYLSNHKVLQCIRFGGRIIAERTFVLHSPRIHQLRVGPLTCPPLSRLDQVW